MFLRGFSLQHLLLEIEKVFEFFREFRENRISRNDVEISEEGSEFLKFFLFFVLEMMLVEPDTTDIDFKFIWGTFLLIVSFWEDGIFLISSNCIIFIERDICQPWKLLLKKLFLNDKVPIFLKIFLPWISHQSWLQPHNIRRYLFFNLIMFEQAIIGCQLFRFVYFLPFSKRLPLLFLFLHNRCQLWFHVLSAAWELKRSLNF